MLRESYQEGINEAFFSMEKIALNALKARQMASGFNLLPEGQWKWALRNLRKGKTPQDLGMAPQGLVNSVKRLGSEVEAGGLWGKGLVGKEGRLVQGDANSADIHRLGKKLGGSPTYMNAMANYIPGIKNRNSTVNNSKLIFNELKKSVNPKVNTIHSHPNTYEAKFNYSAEKDAIPLIRNIDPEPIVNGLESQVGKKLENPDKIRNLLNNRSTSIADALHNRHSPGISPMLKPSGFVPKNPLDNQAMDYGIFLRGNVGTHHNIVSPGIGTSVHTVRPNANGLKNKGLRSTYWKE